MQDRDHRNNEDLTREVEKIGSQIRSMSIQIEAIRARVSDLESWGPRYPGGTVKAAGKDEDGGKGKDENNGKGKKGGKEGNGNGNGNGNYNEDGNGKGKRGKG